MFRKNLLSLLISGVLFAPFAYAQPESSDGQDDEAAANETSAGKIAGIPVETAVAVGMWNCTGYISRYRYRFSWYNRHDGYYGNNRYYGNHRHHRDFWYLGNKLIKLDYPDCWIDGNLRLSP